ncbi:MAG: GxxExxY protein [Candidatus Marinimicrobia bacterium]|nr:GxxExxY protein [Candidatus Neomarinimicrobiota bacterium]
MKIYPKLPQRSEELGKMIVEAAYQVHKNIGPGLLESIYEKCLIYELKKMGLTVESQVEIPFSYNGKNINISLRLDILVEKSVIIEAKSVESILPVHKAQLISYLKLTNNRLGFLINFNVPLIKEGIHRFVN